jgi:hypothetical protein
MRSNGSFWCVWKTWPAWLEITVSVGGLRVCSMRLGSCAQSGGGQLE